METLFDLSFFMVVLFQRLAPTFLAFYALVLIFYFFTDILPRWKRRRARKERGRTDD